MDNLQKIPEYIRSLIDNTRDKNKRVGLENQIIALKNIQGTDSGLQQSINTLREQLKRLIDQIKANEKKIAELRQGVVEFRDEEYAAFISAKVEVLTPQEISGNLPANADKIKRAADNDWDERLPLGGLPSRKLDTAPNRVRAQYYLNNAITAWEQKKLDKLNQLNAVTPPESLVTPTIEDNISKTEDVLNSLAESNQELNAIKDAQDIEVDSYQPGVKPIPATDTAAVVKNMAEQSGYTSPTFIPSDIAFEPSDVPQTLFVASEAAPVIQNQFDSTGLASRVSDPFSEIDYVRTQRMVFENEPDLYDPREVEIVIPNSFSKPVPAYIKVIDITGVEVETSADLPTLDRILSPNSGLIYNQFSIRTLNQQYGEKFQIDENLSEGLAIFGFGKKPKIWQVSGTLLNDPITRWKVKFEEAFDRHLRLAVCIKNRSYVKMTLPAAGIEFTGFPVQLDLLTDITSEGNVPFSMPFIVRDYKRLTNITVSPALKKMVEIISRMSSTNSRSTRYSGISPETDLTLGSSGGLA